MENNIEEQALRVDFNEFVYGDITPLTDKIVSHIEEAIRETSEELNRQINLNDIYRALGYASIKAVNRMKAPRVDKDRAVVITNYAQEAFNEYIANKNLSIKEAYTLPLLIMDILAYQVYRLNKEALPIQEEDAK